MERYPHHYEHMILIELAEHIEKRLRGESRFSPTDIMHHVMAAGRTKGLYDHSLDPFCHPHLWIVFALYRRGYRHYHRSILHWLPETERPPLTQANHYLFRLVNERHELIDGENGYCESKVQVLMQTCQREGLLSKVNHRALARPFEEVDIWPGLSALSGEYLAMRAFEALPPDSPYRIELKPVVIQEMPEPSG